MSNQRGCARREGQRLRENGKSEARQAMADITLARPCPCMSMAPVLTILRLEAALRKKA
jgi:hypothetical protein